MSFYWARRFALKAEHPSPSTAEGYEKMEFISLPGAAIAQSV
jgi:hypothetical protein